MQETKIEAHTTENEAGFGNAMLPASLPMRVQRKRTKGWKMPENTVYVGRPTKWGNPYQVSCNATDEFRKKQIEKYKQSMSQMLKQDAIKELKGKNLACFCSLDKPCHADVLLALANCR